MKIAPLMEAMRREPLFEVFLVHTGQHYDEEMSRLFFEHLGIPEPDINLGVGSGTHAVQTAQIMLRFEQVVYDLRPQLVVVVGDVNSTIACSLVAAKLHIPVAHVEAGLRSFDRRMPEEINRLLTDAIADFLFITEESARRNLLREGVAEEKIFFVGNVMIDTLLKHKKKAESSAILAELGLLGLDTGYGVLTLHRPSNVDDVEVLGRILAALEVLGRHLPIVFPVHPRTRKQLERFGFWGRLRFLEPRRGAQLCRPGVYCLPPLGYLDFLQLMSKARLVLTDSGGMQEETTVLGVPCITLRENTERPVTVELGTNVVVGTDKERIIQEGLKVIAGEGKKGSIPPGWDGLAAQRIVDVLRQEALKFSG